MASQIVNRTTMADQLCMGYHVLKEIGDKIPKKLPIVAKQLQEKGFKPAAQIFTIGPQTAHVNFETDELEEIAKVVDQYSMKLFIHGAYIHTPWSKSERSITGIVKELIHAKLCHAQGVIVHLSKNAAVKENLHWVLNKINEKLPVDWNASDPALYMEINSPKSGNQTFETPAKLGVVINSIPDDLVYRIGYCIDTAHLYASGVSFRYANDVREWMDAFIIQLDENPILIHLNDSDSILGSGKDEHAPLYNKIWNPNDDESGLMELLKIASSYDIPLILERHKGIGVEHDLDIVAGLMKQ